MPDRIEYDYKHISFDANDSDSNITEALNLIGSLGWELVSREFHPETDDENAFYTAVFKRPKK